MSRRRERVKLNGFTNRERPVNLERSPIHEASYSYTDYKLGVPRNNQRHITPNPIHTQMNFYKSRSKPSRYIATSERPRPKLPSCFNYVGGDTDGFVPNAHAKAGNLSMRASEHPKFDLMKPQSKEEAHRLADQETQLIHHEPTHSLENTVNLEKVREIRRLIKRRYANRKDFRKIFNYWDQGNLGVVRAEDMQNMINRMGIPINSKEATALLATANTSKSGTLSMDEFIQMIFGESEVLNADLSGKELVSKYEHEVNLHTLKTQNELKVLIKEQAPAILSIFKKEDKTKSGVVKFDGFCTVLNNLIMPLTIPSQKHFRLLYQSYGGTEDGIAYKDFMNSLKDVNENEALRLDPKREIVHPLMDQVKTAQPAPRKDRFTLLDRQALPPNKLEYLYKKSRPLRKFLQKNFSMNQIQEKLGERATLSEVKAFIEQTLEEKQQGTTLNELQAFLSCFIHNKNSEIAVSDLANYIFADEQSAANSLYHRTRSLPPIENTPGAEDTDIQSLLYRIEQKMVIEGSKTNFKLFRAFDMDRDGFLTRSDIENALVKHSVYHSDKEVDAFLRFLDPQNKGSVSFNDFAKTINGPVRTRNISQPSVESFQEVRGRIQEVNDKHEELRSLSKGFDLSVEIRPKTKYGATPQDTSGGFMAPNPASSCYASDHDRFMNKRLNPFSLAKEDKERYSQARNNRITYIQNARKNFNDLIQENEDKISMRDTQKVVSIYTAKEDYLYRVSMNSYN